MEEGPRYRAFISYSHVDRGWAKWLQRALESYVVPRRLVGRPTTLGPTPRRLRPIFRDRSDLAADADLGSRIDAAIEQSAALIVICSPSAARSPWVRREIGHFVRVHGDRRVFAVIVSGTPNADETPGRDNDESFPLALRFRLDDAGAATESRRDVIAADLRVHGDGRRLARLKLAAGLLEVDLDDLIRRDGQRRLRQFGAVTAASVAGAVIMAGMTFEAIRARDEAQRQRASAEDLVSFMLGDLKTNLEPLGRLDLLKSVTTAAMNYSDRQRPGELDAGATAQRAEVLQLIGAIDEDKGDLASASRHFAQADALTTELLRRHPHDERRLFDQAQSAFYLGDLAHRVGDTASAERSFRAYKRLAHALTTLAPGSDRWRRELVYADTDLGVLLLEQGRTAPAVSALAEGLAANLTLLARRPADRDRMRDVGQSYAWLADAQLRSENLEEDLRDRLAERAVYNEMLKRQPDDNEALEALAVNDMAVANVRDLLGAEAAAIAEIDTCLERYRRLLAIEPSNTTYQARYARALIKASAFLLRSRNPTEAARAARQAITVSTDLVAIDPSATSWQGELLGGARLAEILVAASLARDRPQLEARLSRVTPEARRLALLAVRKPADRPLARVFAEALVIAGDAERLQGRNEEARRSWTRAQNTLETAGIRGDSIALSDLPLVNQVSARIEGRLPINVHNYRLL
jgi:tetratricopeptide (TPR) repeat protein